MDRYRYHPLPPVRGLGRTPSFTRLMTLRAGNYEDPLKCCLEVEAVEHAPPYEALSYTWGRGEPMVSMFIDGRPLPVKPNLEHALRHLRLSSQDRRLWIDAICIDQSNVSERSRQVEYMRLIYKHAARVIVWLGCKSPGIELAFELAQRLAKLVYLPAGTEPMDQDMYLALESSVLESLPPTAIDRLDELFAREYFTRSWCIQEVVVCSSAVAKCEDLEMPFFDLLSTLPVVHERHVFRFTGRPYPFWRFIYLKRLRPEEWKTRYATKAVESLGTLSELLSNSRDFRVTDPRDKIYSLLGICDEGLEPLLAMATPEIATRRVQLFLRAGNHIRNALNRVLPEIDLGKPDALRPNYEKGVREVYRDITRLMIRNHPQILDVFTHVQHNDDPAQSLFPSWVPRWSEAASCEILGTRGFAAGLCDGVRTCAIVHDNPLSGHPNRPDVMSLDGYYLDTVRATSDVMVYGPDDAICIEGMRNQVYCDPRISSHSSCYRNGDLLAMAICLTLVANQQGGYTGDMADGPNPWTHPPPVQNPVDVYRQRIRADAAKFIITAYPEYASFGLHAEAEGGDMSRFVFCVKHLSRNRRLYLTQGGYLGLGPKIMRPGDEVCVLFGGRVPFILRRSLNHHVFIGETYLHDDDIMSGRTTEAVRFNRSNIPALTFELH